MGLLPKLEPMLDEPETVDSAGMDTIKLINDVTSVCLNAIDEAKQFYATLV